MKRLLAFLTSIALCVSLCACSGGAETSISLDVDEIIGSSAFENEQTSVDPDFDEVAQLTDYSSVPYKFMERLAGIRSFVATTDGKTATILEQTIHSDLIKDGERGYLMTKSESALVKTGVTAYYKSGSARWMFKDEKQFTNGALTEYVALFGIYPLGGGIEGYAVNETTVLSVEKLESEQNYKFAISLDPETSTDAVKVQMKKFGSLDEYPKFSEVKITLTFDKHFTPITVELLSKYKAKLLFTAECVQTYTVTYSSINAQVSIPASENFDLM